MIRSKKEQRGLNEPAVRPVQPAQEVVVPQPVHTPDDGVMGIPTAAPQYWCRGWDPRYAGGILGTRVGSSVRGWDPRYAGGILGTWVGSSVRGWDPRYAGGIPDPRTPSSGV